MLAYSIGVSLNISYVKLEVLEVVDTQLLYCLLGYKLEQPSFKIVWHSLLKLKIFILYDPEIPDLAMNPKEVLVM